LSTFAFRSENRRKRTSALLGCHDVNATRYLGYLFAVAFGAPYLRCLVLGHGFGALERLPAFSTTILVSRHVSPPQPWTLPIKLFQRNPACPIQHRNAAECRKRWCNENKSWASRSALDIVCWPSVRLILRPSEPSISLGLKDCTNAIVLASRALRSAKVFFC
jgi:hypothetical protein